MENTENETLKLLALALPCDTPNHRLEYLLKKLYKKDAFVLDAENSKFLERIKEIAERLNDGI